LAKPEQAASGDAAQPPQIVDFFDAMVRRLLAERAEYVLSAVSGELNIDVLHMINPRSTEPGKRSEDTGFRAGYHYVYETLHTETGINKIGVVVANPLIKAPIGQAFYDRERTNRHYFTEGATGVRRHDLVNGRPIFRPLLEGTLQEPDVLDQPPHDLIVMQFKRDMATVQTREPIRLASTSIQRHVDL